MIYDCFMFRDELDMLEVRLREFEDRDVRHVLVEAPFTHRGGPKPLYYAENQERFAPWAERVSPIVAAGLDVPMDPWAREHAQRDAAMLALRDAAGDDVILVSDVDEFPPWPLPDPDPVTAFRMRLMMYAADWEYPEPHICSVAARWNYVKNRGLAAVRDGRCGYPVTGGGMHLTWLGGPAEQARKLAVTCHLELSAESADLIASGRCYREGIHHSGTCQMIPAEVDQTWPKMIRERKCPPSWFRPR